MLSQIKGRLFQFFLTISYRPQISQENSCLMVLLGSFIQEDRPRIVNTVKSGPVNHTFSLWRPTEGEDALYEPTQGKLWKGKQA